MLCMCIKIVTTRAAAAAWALWALAAGCFGQSLGPGGDDAGYGAPPDLAPACVGNNDGVIAPGELVFPIGLAIKYLTNPANTTVAVAPDGTPSPDRPEWDLTSTAGELHLLALESVSDQAVASSVPGAT